MPTGPLSTWLWCKGGGGGAEAAINAARHYLHNINPIMKLDFKNAFNSVCRDKMLSAVLELAPESCSLWFTLHHLLFWGEIEGAQQGDSLGPLLLTSTSFRSICNCIQSSSCYTWMSPLGNNSSMIIQMIEHESHDLGLEVICIDSPISTSLLSLIPGAKTVFPSAATLLGPP